jgi:hypothetical protein
VTDAMSASDGRTKDEDRAMESAVLQRVIDVHPAPFTLPELVRELAGEEPDFAARDAIERAARELSGVGLVHLTDDFVRPTRAALRYTDLLEG